MLAQLVLLEDLLAAAARGPGIEGLRRDLVLFTRKEIPKCVGPRSSLVSRAVAEDLVKPVVGLLDEVLEMSRMKIETVRLIKTEAVESETLDETDSSEARRD